MAVVCYAHRSTVYQDILIHAGQLDRLRGLFIYIGLDHVRILFVRVYRLFVCLLLNGTSALFRPLVPRIVEIEHKNHVKNDLK